MAIFGQTTNQQTISVLEELLEWLKDGNTAVLAIEVSSNTEAIAMIGVGTQEVVLDIKISVTAHNRQKVRSFASKFGLKG